MNHLEAHGARDVEQRIATILDAFEVLRSNPRVGRPTTDGMRELVIGSDTRGDIGLYYFDPLRDEVVIVGVRAQRESGFRP